MAADTLPDGHRFGFPFSREEYIRALMLVYPPDEADATAARLFDAVPEGEVFGITVMDGDLLLLALLSDELAARVLAHRPALRETVAFVRANRDNFLAEWRASVAGESPG